MLPSVVKLSKQVTGYVGCRIVNLELLVDNETCTRDNTRIGNGGVSGLIYVTIVVTPRCGAARAPSVAGMLYAVRYSWYSCAACMLPLSVKLVTFRC